MSVNHQTRRRFLAGASLAGTSALVLGASRLNGRLVEAASSKRTDLSNRLFIMGSCWYVKNGWDALSCAKALNQVGVSRTSYCLRDWKAMPRMIETLDREKVQLVAVYDSVDIETGTIPPHLNKLIERLAGRDTFLWIGLTSKKYKPSDLRGDDAAVRIMRTISDSAQKARLQVSIYHHRNFWGEKADDAFRIAQKTDRTNVGCTFNLYHWLSAEGPEGLEEKAARVLPKLNCVTINGSCDNASEMTVEEGILPLGEGTYDVERFVKTFVRLGYDGPVGLQGYGIDGDIPAKLRQSVREFSGYCERIDSSDGS